MKKMMIVLLAAVLFVTGCGVGTYSVSTGKADTGFLSFTTVEKKSYPILVTVDGKNYEINAVKQKAYRTSDRNIKETSLNTISIVPGTHTVKVFRNGEEIYSKTLFVSAQEHKLVDL